MNKTLVKLGSITSLSDARWAAAADVALIGFNFNLQSENFIPPIKAKEIAAWTTGPAVVAEFENNTVDEIENIAALLEADYIETNNCISNLALKKLAIPFIIKLNSNSLNNHQILEIINTYNDALAFNIEIIAKNFNEDFLKQLCAKYKLILTIAETEDLLPVIKNLKPLAINIISKKEEKTGIKDYDKLNNIIKRINGHLV